MAGAGYKLFNTGDVLTAAQVNTYLQEQTVMVFASSTARTTALSGVLAEGMMSYLQDTNAVEVYNGTSWVNVGNAGDITEVQAGTGISVASGTGPIPVITNTVATAFDAAGDLVYGTGADTFTKLALGTAGQVLKVNSGATAPEWGAAGGGDTFAAGKNKITNGDFRINQRAFTSNTTAGSYNFDRWFQDNDGGTVTCTPQTFTLGAAPVAGYEGTTFLRQVTASQTLTSHYAQIRHKIESVRTFAGQTATLSFYAKAASATPQIAPLVQQNFGTGGSPSAAVNTVGSSVTLSTSWARYSVTISVPSISGKTLGTANNDFLGITLWTSAGSDYNSLTNSLGLQNNTFDIWGVQLEAGSTATDFQTATGILAGELAACQRYYQQFGGGMSGAWDSTTTAIFFSQYPVTMRVAPTVALLTTSPQVGVQGAADVTGSGSAIAFSSIGSKGFRVGINGFTGATQYRGNWVSTQSTDILSASAEL